MFDHTHYEGKVRGHILDSLDAWAKEGRPTGGFLKAVLENDLKGALGKADLENRRAIFEIVKYIYNELPIECWGNEDKVKRWQGLNNGGLAPKEETISGNMNVNLNGSEYIRKDKVIAKLNNIISTVLKNNDRTAVPNHRRDFIVEINEYVGKLKGDE